jgi:hypothetical protein
VQERKRDSAQAEKLSESSAKLIYGNDKAEEKNDNLGGWLIAPFVARQINFNEIRSRLRHSSIFRRWIGFGGFFAFARPTSNSMPKKTFSSIKYSRWRFESSPSAYRTKKCHKKW